MDAAELKELKEFIADLKAERAAVKEKEKRDSWTKYVSLTIVIIAVLSSIASQWSGKYSSRVQISQARASDAWNLYQARSVKGHLLEVTTNTLAKMARADEPEIQKMIKGYGRDVAKYDEGKDQSQKIARAYEDDRDTGSALGGKLGPAVPLFTVSIAMASVCLLTKKKPLWLLAIATAAVACVYMISARLAETPAKGPSTEQSFLAPKPAPEKSPASN